MSLGFEFLAVDDWVSRQGIQREVPGQRVRPLMEQRLDSRSLVQLVAQSNHKPLGTPDALAKVPVRQPARPDNNWFCRRTRLP